MAAGRVDAIYASSKYWKLLIIPITSVNRTTGVIIGSVTWRNRCQALAPSTVIASYSSRGTFRSPAR